MSWSCPVVVVGAVQPHPWADKLNLTEVQGCPVVIGKELNPGDLAVFIPVDSVVDTTKPWFAFLANRKGSSKSKESGLHRIKAAKIRGVFSMGLMLPLPEGLSGAVGEDLSSQLGAVKYEEPVDGPKMGGEQLSPPLGAPGPYGVSAYRTYKELLKPGEEVVITEKIHGCNVRFMNLNGQFYVGSHNCWWKPDEKNLWWSVAYQYGMSLKVPEGVVVYGEVYGDVQDMKYDISGLKLAIFDAQVVGAGRFWDWAYLQEWCRDVGLPVVPLLYRGPYSHELTYGYAQGQSTIAGHLREGCVVKPEPGRGCLEIGRVILKLHGEEFLLRKYGTEHH